MPELSPDDYAESAEPTHFYDSPDELDLDSTVPYTFVLVDGAFNASYWHPFGEVLRAAGHNVVQPILPLQDPNATFEDDTDVIRKEIKDCRNIVFMPHSRGVETTRLLATEDLGRFVAAQIVSSGGPHAYLLHPSSPEALQGRYSDAYRRAIVRKPNNMTSIGPDDARYFLYHDVENESLATAVADNLRDQRNSEHDTSPPFRLPSSDDLPIKVWLGVHDRALNIPRAYRVFKQWAGITPDLLPTGHSPQLAMINLLARYSIDYANRARKKRLI